jgi:hypothetical protein
MTPFAYAVHLADPDLGFESLASIRHHARGFCFEFYVCRLTCSGQYRIYVAKDGERCGYIFDPLHDRESRRASAAEAAIVEDLIRAAKIDVEENLWDLY